MRIALVHPKFGSFGGAEKYAQSLAEGLYDQGQAVHLVGRKARHVSKKIAFHRVPALNLGRGIKTWSFSKLASRSVKPVRFDIIQGFGKTVCQNIHRTGGGVHRAYLARMGKQERSLYDRIVLRIEDTLFKTSILKAVICPSRWVVEEVKQYYPETAEKLQLIPNGVDTTAFHPGRRELDRKELVDRLNIPASAAIVLFVASNFYLKGLDMALDMLSCMPQTVLVVLGNDDPGPYRSKARELGIADRLHFEGRRDKTAPYYRAADALIHPTRYDPFANVCLEALACGTPVVTTDRNGVADLIGEQRGGKVVALSGGGEALAQALQELFDQGDAQQRAARKVALQNDRSLHVSRVIDLYRQVAGVDA